MQRIVEGLDRTQSTLFPERLEDRIGDLFGGLAQALMGETALPELSALKWDRARLAEQFRSASNLAAQPIEQALAAAAEKAELASATWCRRRRPRSHRSAATRRALRACASRWRRRPASGSTMTASSCVPAPG